MNPSLKYALGCGAVIAAVWVLGLLLVQDATVRKALGITAALAFVVQMVAFQIARRWARKQNVIAGWGIGIMLRFGVLVIFALVVAPRFGLPLSASLLGLATFLFISTLIEPLFLKT